MAKNNTKPYHDKGFFISLSILIGMVFASFFIPNTNIRQPNPILFSAADMQRSNFYKSIQFYYNSGQWNKLQGAIENFEESPGDIIRKVELLGDGPISNAIADSDRIKYVTPDSIEEIKISERVSSYTVRYSLDDTGFKRFGLKLHSSISDDPKLFNTITIFDENEVIEKSGVIYKDELSADSSYLFTHEISNGSKSFSVQFISRPSYEEFPVPQKTSDWNLAITPSNFSNGKEINFVLNDENNIAGFRNGDIYTINSNVLAGICTRITLSSNPNISLTWKVHDGFSFQEEDKLEETFSYRPRDNSLLGELMFHDQIDFLGLKDYGTVRRSIDCQGISRERILI